LLTTDSRNLRTILKNFSSGSNILAVRDRLQYFVCLYGNYGDLRPNWQVNAASQTDEPEIPRVFPLFHALGRNYVDNFLVLKDNELLAAFQLFRFYVTEREFQTSFRVVL